MANKSVSRKDYLNNTCFSNNARRIKGILKHIEDDDISGNGFSQDKNAIDIIFNNTSSEKVEDILARLTIIDSFYSTQMNRRYYGLDELAESIFLLAKQRKKPIADLFINFAKNQDTSRFNFTKIEGGHSIPTNLFDEKYGIGKDGGDKGIAISLISKYAYFETRKHFPIYDSIACEVYPLLWTYCGFLKKEQPKLIVRIKGSQVINASETMRSYVNAINILIDKLGGGISYDHLDRLLWFTGKIRRGNLSLVLSREQFDNCLDYSQKNHLFKETNEFSIQKVKDVNKLPFLKKGSLLQDFFCLAKELQ